MTFTYQGRLNGGTNAASGTYDLRFTIYASSDGPGVLAGPLTNWLVAARTGLLTARLDLGAGAFPGAERWPEIVMRTNTDRRGQ